MITYFDVRKVGPECWLHNFIFQIPVGDCLIRVPQMIFHFVEKIFCKHTGSRSVERRLSGASAVDHESCDQDLNMSWEVTIESILFCFRQ